MFFLHFVGIDRWKQTYQQNPDRVMTSRTKITVKQVKSKFRNFQNELTLPMNQLIAIFHLQIRPSHIALNSV